MLPCQQTFPLSAQSNPGLLVVLPSPQVSRRANYKDEPGVFDGTFHPSRPVLINVVLIKVAIETRLPESVRQVEHPLAVSGRVVSVAHENWNGVNRFGHEWQSDLRDDSIQKILDGPIDGDSPPPLIVSLRSFRESPDRVELRCVRTRRLVPPISNRAMT